jgi:hypothetical protein
VPFVRTSTKTGNTNSYSCSTHSFFRSILVKFFESIEPEDEHEIEHIVANHPDQIEDDLTYLDHQLSVGTGFMDVLCVDDKGVPVVVELKIGEDEGILMQALRYYDSVYRERDRLAHQYQTKAEINLEEDPRIILVAPRISEGVLKATRYVKPEIKLLEYDYLRSKSGDKGIHVKELPLEAEEGYSPPVPVEKILSYINDRKLRGICDQVVGELCDIGEGIESRGAGETLIRIRYRSRWLADISARRSFFRVWYDSDRKQDISSKKDWLGSRDRIIKITKKLYEQLGGAPK